VITLCAVLRIWVAVLVLYNLVACGGNVAVDSGASAGGAGANVAGGATPGQSNGSVTGGASSYPGGMTPITPDEVNRLRGQACAESTDNSGSCVLGIPAAPAGQVIDPLRITIVYNVNDQSTDFILIGQTYDTCPVQDGWYFDSSQTRMFLCPHTCSKLSEDMNPGISVLAGCAICGCICMGC